MEIHRNILKKMNLCIYSLVFQLFGKFLQETPRFFSFVEKTKIFLFFARNHGNSMKKRNSTKKKVNVRPRRTPNELRTNFFLAPKKIMLMMFYENRTNFLGRFAIESTGKPTCLGQKKSNVAFQPENQSDIPNFSQKIVTKLENLSVRRTPTNPDELRRT